MIGNLVLGVPLKDTCTILCQHRRDSVKATRLEHHERLAGVCNTFCRICIEYQCTVQSQQHAREGSWKVLNMASCKKFCATPWVLAKHDAL